MFNQVIECMYSLLYNRYINIYDPESFTSLKLCIFPIHLDQRATSNYIPNPEQNCCYTRDIFLQNLHIKL